MKFLHIADLHIGKVVNDFSMLEDQKFILEQIEGMAVENQVDGLLIAGDIYDRAIPTAEAVSLLDRFMTHMSERGVSAFLVSGNHDSPERISFGRELLCESDIYIAGMLGEKLTAVSVFEGDMEVQVVLLPFIKPAQAGVKTTQEAVEKVLSAYWENEKERTDIKRILVTHYFVTDAGREPELSDSETTVHVGGLDNVDASVFHGFDYVALGHIHKPQQIGAHPIRYAGSPLQYSFSEVGQTKNALLVSVEENGIDVKSLPLWPMREMKKLTGTLKELMEDEHLQLECGQDYIQAILTDKGELIDPIGTLRSAYPNVMQIIRQERFLTGSAEGIDTSGRKALAQRKETDALFAAFYQEVRGEELSEEGKKVIAELIKEIEE